jgi:hypothetical protein
MADIKEITVVFNQNRNSVAVAKSFPRKRHSILLADEPK